MSAHTRSVPWLAILTHAAARGLTGRRQSSGGIAFLIGLLLWFECSRSRVRFGPNPLGSILPPSDRERRLGRRSRSFCVSEPLKLTCDNPADDCHPTLPQPPPRLHRAHGRARPRRGRVPAGGAIRQPVAVGQPDAGPHGLTERRRLGRPVRACVARRPVRDYASIEDQVRTIRGPRRRRRRSTRSSSTTPASRRSPPTASARTTRRRSSTRTSGCSRASGCCRRTRTSATSTSSSSASQVAGLYSPDDKQLYVVSRSGKLGPTEKTTFAHEYTHALQDQNFDLGSLKLDEVGEGDKGDRAAVARRRRRDARHVALADPAPQPGGAAAAPQRVAQPRGLGQSSTRCRRSSASRCCSRTRPA